MAKSRGETYYENIDNTESKSLGPARCVVENCKNPIVAEVHIDDYATALMMFRGIRREKIPYRRSGDERFFICRTHLEGDQRMAELRWQWLMFEVSDGG
jgi:hypothetical protein